MMDTIVVRFSSLGDCVLLCPLFEHLKEHGATRITVVTKQAYAELFAAARGVDRVVAIEPGRGLGALAPVIGKLRRGDSVVIDAHSSMRSRWLCRRLGGSAARFEKHYGDKAGLILFKRRRSLPAMLESYGKLGAALDCATSDLSPGGLTLPATAMTRAESLLPGDQPAIALAPGARWATKRWSVNRFAEAALTARNKMGLQVVVVGDRADRAAAAPLLEALGGDCLDTTGQLSLIETAAVISRCQAFVGNDSGLTHLAEAVQTPVVAIFGPTVKEFGYYPSLPRSRVVEHELACRPCSRNGARPCLRNNHECMTAIPVTAVVNAVQSVIEPIANR